MTPAFSLLPSLPAPYDAARLPFPSFSIQTISEDLIKPTGTCLSLSSAPRERTLISRSRWPGRSSSDAHRLPPPHRSYKTLPSARLLPPLLDDRPVRPAAPAPPPPWHEKMAACSRGLAWPPFDLTTARGAAPWPPRPAPRRRAAIRCCCAGAEPEPRRLLSRAAAAAPERAEEWRVDGNKPSAAAPGRRRASLTAMPSLPFPAPRYEGRLLAMPRLGGFVFFPVLRTCGVCLHFTVASRFHHSADWCFFFVCVCAYFRLRNDKLMCQCFYQKFQIL
jgi:hypothetical protein